MSSSSRASSNKYLARYYKDESPVVAPSLCVLMDLLGLADRVCSCTSPIESNRLLRVFHDRATFVRDFLEIQAHRHPYQLFSDCLVLGMPFTGALADNELPFIAAVAEYHFWLVNAGFAVRGGLSMGELHIGGHTCFGKALVEAHHIERHHAQYPRIVLAPQVAELVEASPERYKKLLLRSDDGHLFVDYLNVVNWQGSTDWELLEQHRDFVIRGLAEFADNEDVRPKYDWLRDYHNYFCDTEAYYHCDELDSYPPPGGSVDYLLIEGRGSREFGFEPVCGESSFCTRVDATRQPGHHDPD